MKLKIVLLLLALSTKLSAQIVPNKNINLLHNLKYTTGQRLSNIWGHVDSLGNEYALVGWRQGVSIVNVTNPTNPIIDTNINNDLSNWREIKTYKGFAFVATENGSYLQIIDLRSLPNKNGIHVKNTAITSNIETESIHSLHIDTTKGFLYLNGKKLSSNKGSYVFDLKADPWNPVYVGKHDMSYVHDGYVDNDTLYACHIYDGVVRIVDMRSKTAPVVLAQIGTPGVFPHNTWLSNNHKTLFTTDEVPASCLTAYDISDLSSIYEMDRIKSQYPNSGSIVHNTCVKNNWAVTAWYADGVIITDITKPDNLVNVGWYDTSPNSGAVMNGAWGAYPYLPSGNIVVGDMTEGLFVLQPNYVRACYLEGTITDSLCHNPMNNVQIVATKAGSTFSEYTNNLGELKTGTVDSGYYTLTIAKPGYITKTITNVYLQNGQTTIINASLLANQGVSIVGAITDSISNDSIPNCLINITNSNNTYNGSSNAHGEYSNCNIPSGVYDIKMGKWGYKGYCKENVLIDNMHTNMNTKLEKGYKDDFNMNLGWQVNGSVTMGAWERGVPHVADTVRYICNSNPQLSSFRIPYPASDDAADCSNMAYVTCLNNLPTQGSAYQYNVNTGYTELTSPVFDLTNVTDPYINYSRWFFNNIYFDCGSGSSYGNGNDTMKIIVSNGIQEKVLEKIDGNMPYYSQWLSKSFRVQNYLTPTATMQLKVYIRDYAPESIVVGGFDNFEVTSLVPVTITSITEEESFVVFPNPTNTTFTLQLEPNNTYTKALVFDVMGRMVENISLSNTNQHIIGSTYTSGIYTVRLLKKDGSSTSTKIIKTN